MAPKKILILEDDVLLAQGLTRDLESLGLEVLGPAFDCGAALELLLRDTPDLAILDTHLGEETCEVVLEQCLVQNVPVLISTGQDQREVPVFAAGHRRLGKPYIIDQLPLAIGLVA